MTEPIRTLEDLRDRILAECSDSDVGLWWIASDVEEFLETEDQERVRETTLQLLDPLLATGLIQPFDITDEGMFVLWTEAPGEAMSRIDSEWRELTRNPQQNEIVWFTATPDGREVVKRDALEGRW